MLLPTEVLIQNIKNRITVDKDYDSNDEYESIYGDTNGLTHFKHSRTGTYQFFGWYLKGRPLTFVVAYPELMGAEKKPMVHRRSIVDICDRCRQCDSWWRFR